MQNDYEIYDGVLSAYNGTDTDIIIPDGVTEIKFGVFLENENLTSIVIPGSVKTIGYRAFKNCKNLTSVKLSKGLTKIESEAFMFCSNLASINIPDGVTEIKGDAFCGCKLTSLVIPDSVTVIDYEAFAYCRSLTSINIPDSLASLGKNAFIGCDGLFDADGFFIQEGTLIMYGGRTPDVVIPKSVTTIGRSAFKDRWNLHSVVIPENVKKIGSSAFYSCENLTSVKIADSVTEIPIYAFGSCKKLTSVRIPDRVTKIGDCAFSNCEKLTSITLPDSLTEIGESAFGDCKALSSLKLPNSLKKIGAYGIGGCTSLKTLMIPQSVTEIEVAAFRGCKGLTSVDIKGRITTLKAITFRECKSLTSVRLPDSLKKIEESAFLYCSRLESVAIPDSVTTIESQAFWECDSLASVIIPDSVTEIGRSVFYKCKRCTVVCPPGSYTQKYCENNKIPFRAPDDINRTVSVDGFEIRDGVLLKYSGGNSDIDIPDFVTVIGREAFCGCESIVSVRIPDSVFNIERGAFADCTSLELIIIPDSVTEINKYAFKTLLTTTATTVICREGSYAHRYCVERHYAYLFDYQYEAFHGIIPPGIEKLSSPFLADEEKPYIFISYSHKDRDEVLGIIKALYEAGWKIWYDEGLTIGDKYDETLEAHIKNCSAFLLFVTKNSLESLYIEENEIPWAIEFGKPIIKCIVDEGLDYKIDGGRVMDTVSPSAIEPALEKVDRLTKGERREAKGISVVIDPANRSEGNDDGFAYCIYSPSSAPKAKAILLEAKNGGCTLYDAVKNGEDEERLKACACLIVFLDKAFLADERLTKMLIDEYKAKKDMAICQLDEIEDSDLPEGLVELHLMQWLNFVYGITGDMNSKLARHLQKRGCRNTSVLPGFEYEKTDEGIVITRYNGLDPEPRIESEYGGIPVVEIGESAFKGCVQLKALTIPNGVTEIGRYAFENCSGLAFVDLPDSIKRIDIGAFDNCTSLTKLTIPGSVEDAFGYHFLSGLTNLKEVIIQEGVTTIGSQAFDCCESLSSVIIPDSVTEIGRHMSYNCKRLIVVCSPGSYAQRYCEENKRPFRSPNDINRTVSVDGFEIRDGILLKYSGNSSDIAIPDFVKIIAKEAFLDCKSIVSVRIPDSVFNIEDNAFSGCTSLESIIIPDSVIYIGEEAFSDCTDLTVICSPESFAWNFCEDYDLFVEAPESGQNAPSVNASDMENRSSEENPSGLLRRGFFSRLFGKK